MPLCCCCCFRRRSSGRRSGRGTPDVPGKGKQENDLQSPLSCNSYISEYYDAQENFPIPEGPSPVCSTSGTPRQSVAKEKPAEQPANGVANGHDNAAHYHPQQPSAADGRPVAMESPFQQLPNGLNGSAPPTISVAMATAGHPAAGDVFHPVEASETSEEPLQAGAGGGPMSRFASCLSILESIRIPGSAAGFGGPAAGSPPGAPMSPTALAGPGEATASGTRSRRHAKLEPGSTLKRRDMSASVLDVREAWDECEDEDDGPSTSGRPFMVRGPDYMRTKVKTPSPPALYRLLAADVISSDTKLTHVARHVNLQHLLRPASDPHLPPLLIITIMLPLYPASLFGGSDGPNQSLIYYFGLPPDFNPATYENQAVLGLLRRFVANGREADGSPTRDRFKLLARVVNVEEWAQKGPLSPAEHKLLLNYNCKPILTRPQHFFFSGPGYLEVDIDIHTYQFLARKAFGAYFTRLKEVVFENAFVIQGNSPEELPEQVLGSAKMYRIDFGKSRPLRDFVAPGGASAAVSGGGASSSGGGGAPPAGPVANGGLLGPANSRVSQGPPGSQPAPIPEGAEEQA